MRIGPLYLREPSASEQGLVLDQVPRLNFNGIIEKGSSKDATTLSWKGPAWSNCMCTHDMRNTLVGHGEKDFNRAKSFLKSWQHFNLGWAYTNIPEIAVGRSVIVVAQSLGIWTINPLRVCSRKCSRRKVSFSHRTLEGHQLSGQETFSLEMKSNGDVFYGIETVSQPATLLAALTYPVVRMYQNKFKHESSIRIKNMINSTKI